VTDPPQSKTTSRSSGEQHRPFIEVEFGKRRNAVTIFQDLVEHRVYEGRYNAVKRFMRSLRSHESWVSCRFETSAGAEAQVDYGESQCTTRACGHVAQRSSKATT
jgi:hypothetical protein